MSTIEKALNKGATPKPSRNEAVGHGKSIGGYIEIDLDMLSAKSMVTNRSERSRINEEYRFIKRKVLTNAFGKTSHLLNHPNIILVSSTHEDEGKTFTSINLALSIALEQDKRVLLVDADVVNPSIGTELEYDATNGLLDYLLNKVENIGEVIYNTNIDNLTILPAGSQHHLTHELLSSGRMEELMRELASRYPDRVIILDSPPLIGVSETQVLSSLSGQALIVVEEQRTPAASVVKAIKLLDSELAVGFVLNKTNSKQAAGYGYGYGYGNYYGL